MKKEELKISNIGNSITEVCIMRDKQALAGISPGVGEPGNCKIYKECLNSGIIRVDFEKARRYGYI